MAAPVPSTEPAILVAGDTSAWTKSVSDYPPTEGWSLSYAFRKQSGAGYLNLTASTSNSEYSLTISAASSSLMTAGLWTWASYATAGSERHQVGSGSIEIKPNLAAIDFNIDLRSTAKQAYDNAMAAWKSVTLGQTVMLNGRTYTQHNLDALTRYVDRCKADYAAELQAQQLNQTGVDSRRIGVRLARV